MTDGGKVLGAYYPKQLLFLKRLFVIKRQLDEHKVRQFIYAFFARVGFFIYLLRTLCTTSFSNIHRAQDNIAHFKSALKYLLGAQAQHFITLSEKHTPT